MYKLTKTITLLQDIPFDIILEISISLEDNDIQNIIAVYIQSEPDQYEELVEQTKKYKLCHNFQQQYPKGISLSRGRPSVRSNIFDACK